MDDKARDRLQKIEMKKKQKEALLKTSSNVVGW